jgi:hypothetical protein
MGMTKRVYHTSPAPKRNSTLSNLDIVSNHLSLSTIHQPTPTYTFFLHVPWHFIIQRAASSAAACASS